MTTNLDFRLRLLASQLGDEPVRVLLQYEGDLRSLEETGFYVTSFAGDVAAGSIARNRLEQLAQHKAVVRVGGVRPLMDEMDVSSSAIGLVDPITNLRNLPSAGAGAIIGVIDSGFELTHPTFRNATGQTRVLAAWDQLTFGKAGQPPVGFGYGHEYKQKAIDHEIANGRILTIRNHPDAGTHGTYVTGIAAGNGSRRRIFTGVAPEADLILVSYRKDVPVGGSAFFLDAINYIRQIAHDLGKPVVINISQGDNLGAHDGTTLLERAIDNVVKEGRTLIVTSAGNECGEGSFGHHANGIVTLQEDTVVPFNLMVDDNNGVDGDTLELWYHTSDRFDVAIKPPSEEASEFVSPGQTAVIPFRGGNKAHVYSQVNHPANGDNQIGIVLEKGPMWEAGLWQLILRGTTINKGHFDLWSDRPRGVTIVGFKENNLLSSTITVPGNARYAITVGGFISRRDNMVGSTEVKGAIFPPSSIGPTRDSRIKPDLVAPASLIMAPRMRTDQSVLSYDFNSGTSMAAPHVTGVIALLWSHWPHLSAQQIRHALLSNTDRDPFTGPTQNNVWGAGKVNAARAFKALSNSLKMGGTKMNNKTVFEFEISPQPKPDGSLAGMAVRIEVTNNETIKVTGVSDGEDYEGFMQMRKKGNKPKEGEKLNPQPLGGDQCWIDGKWFDPCPTKQP